MYKQTPTDRLHLVHHPPKIGPPYVTAVIDDAVFASAQRPYRCAECTQSSLRIETSLLGTFSKLPQRQRTRLRKMPKSTTLSLAMRTRGAKEDGSGPMTPMTPNSPEHANGRHNKTASPLATQQDIPQSPSSPKLRKEPKNIFSNFTAAKSSSRLNAADQAGQQERDRDGNGIPYTNGRSGGSTPDLSRSIQADGTDGEHGSGLRNGTGRSNDSSIKGANEGQLKHTEPISGVQRGAPNRSTSVRVNEAGRTRANRFQPAQLSPDATAPWSQTADVSSLRTAPLEKDRTWRHFGKLRTHSADRHDASAHAQRADEDGALRRDRAEQNSLASNSYNESRGAHFMSNIGSGARKMGEKIDSARKGVFGKLGRTSSNNERELQVPKEAYQFRIIHEPLVEQTRLTRISNRLENSKDKTEFWMPALPWRCIDYLNMKGCEEEGLYRVPGAAHQVRYYEQKFDQVRDIDLIADDNLNDPNVIGSLFKNWLRQLPDEIFPKATQSRIQQECQGAKSTPQMLKDELSRLPPFNYYLLFAITCHISLLHSCSEFNKMNYNNLCICFQPAIKIDAFCFQFLILDWRNCWQGCWTEKEYLAEEVKLLVSQHEPVAPQPAAPRNGHVSGKTKGSQSSTYLGDRFKSASARSESSDRVKPSSARGISSDRSVTSGRASPPGATITPAEKSHNAQRSAIREREASRDRNVSSSDSRETVDGSVRAQRAPPTIQSELVDDASPDALPTQSEHETSAPASEKQYKLNLTNPPISPFDVSF